MGGPSGGADIGEIQRKYLPTKKLAAKLSAVEGGKNRRKRGEFLGRHLHLILDPWLFLPSFFFPVSLDLDHYPFGDSAMLNLALSGIAQSQNQRCKRQRKFEPSAVRHSAKSKLSLSGTAQSFLGGHIGKISFRSYSK